MLQVVSLSDYTEPAQRLAQVLNCDYEPVRVHRFPDGESRVSVPPEPAPHVVAMR